MMTTPGALLRVALGEGAAALERDLEDVEVAGRDRHPAAAAMKRAVGRQRAADDDERKPVAALERHAAGGAGGHDAGHRAQALDAVAHHLLDAFGLQEPRSGQRHPHRQDVLRHRSPDRRGRSATAVRISSAEPMSSTSASATSTTTSSERALFWRKPVPERPALSFSVDAEVGARPWSAGDQAEEDARAERHGEREEQHPPVDADERRRPGRCAAVRPC